MYFHTSFILYTGTKLRYPKYTTYTHAKTLDSLEAVFFFNSFNTGKWWSGTSIYFDGCLRPLIFWRKWRVILHPHFSLFSASLRATRTDHNDVRKLEDGFRQNDVRQLEDSDILNGFTYTLHVLTDHTCSADVRQLQDSDIGMTLEFFDSRNFEIASKIFIKKRLYNFIKTIRNTRLNKILHRRFFIKILSSCYAQHVDWHERSCEGPQQ